MKRYLVPVVAGVTVFGAATAFAASLTVTSQSLGSGNSTVVSCNSTASIGHADPAYSASTPYGYEVVTVSITTAAGCNAKSYKVQLTGASNAALANGEKTGTLSATGTATVTYAATDNIAAADVTGVSLVLYG